MTDPEVSLSSESTRIYSAEETTAMIRELTVEVASNSIEITKLKHEARRDPFKPAGETRPLGNTEAMGAPASQDWFKASAGQLAAVASNLLVVAKESRIPAGARVLLISQAQGVLAVAKGQVFSAAALLQAASGGAAPPGPPVAPSPGPDQNGGMEARIAKLETAVEFIQRDIGDIKTDIREIKSHARTDFRVLFGAIIAAALGMAGLMAKGFGWL